MLAHLFIHNGRLAWSGYGASGDPAHVFALVIDVGRDFLITDDGTLYLTGPGPHQFSEFSPECLAVAARLGRLGFRVLEDKLTASWRCDRQDRARRKLGRRGRITQGQQNGRRD